jgi:hypothetical protein
VPRAEVGPAADGHDAAALPALRQSSHDDGQRGEFLCGGLTTHDSKQGALAHSGMFPCFLGGSVSRLLASTRSALVTCTRVCDGGMTAST